MDTARPVDLCVLLARAGKIQGAVRVAGGADLYNENLMLALGAMLEEARKMAEELNRKAHQGSHP